MIRRPLSSAIAGVLNQHAPLYSSMEEMSLLALAHIHRRRGVIEIARPMRELFALLETGEVDELDGKVVMRLPDLDAITALEPDAEWVEVAPAMLGWIDCWQRIAPDIRLQKMQYLAERLQADKAVTPRLVEQARAEFETTIARLHDIPDGRLTQAITTTQIGWEMERAAAQC